MIPSLNRVAAVTARDKTTPIKYNIYLSVVFELLPLMGSNLFALYNVYAALAESGEVWGVRKIAALLGCSHPTVVLQTHALQIFGLIDINPGSRIFPNVVDIIDPPAVAPSFVQETIKRLTTDEIMTRPNALYLKTALFERLASWKPLNEGATLQREKTQDGGNDLVKRLNQIRFNGAKRWLATVDHELVTAWLDEFSSNPEFYRGSSLAAVLRRRVSDGEQPPAPVFADSGPVIPADVLHLVKR